MCRKIEKKCKLLKPVEPTVEPKTDHHFDSIKKPILRKQLKHCLQMNAQKNHIRCSYFLYLTYFISCMMTLYYLN